MQVVQPGDTERVPDLETLKSLVDHSELNHPAKSTIYFALRTMPGVLPGGREALLQRSPAEVGGLPVALLPDSEAIRRSRGSAILYDERQEQASHVVSMSTRCCRFAAEPHGHQGEIGSTAFWNEISTKASCGWCGSTNLNPTPDEEDANAYTDIDDLRKWSDKRFGLLRRLCHHCLRSITFRPTKGGSTRTICLHCGGWAEILYDVQSWNSSDMKLVLFVGPCQHRRPDGKESIDWKCSRPPVALANEDKEVVDPTQQQPTRKRKAMPRGAGSQKDGKTPPAKRPKMMSAPAPARATANVTAPTQTPLITVPGPNDPRRRGHEYHGLTPRLERPVPSQPQRSGSYERPPMSPAGGADPGPGGSTGKPLVQSRGKKEGGGATRKPVASTVVVSTVVVPGPPLTFIPSDLTPTVISELFGEAASLNNSEDGNVGLPAFGIAQSTAFQGEGETRMLSLVDGGAVGDDPCECERTSDTPFGWYDVPDGYDNLGRHICGEIARG